MALIEVKRLASQDYLLELVTVADGNRPADNPEESRSFKEGSIHVTIHVSSAFRACM